MRHQGKIVALSLLTACAFAAQHPFSTPLTARARESVSGMLSVLVLAQIVIFVASIGVLAAAPAARTEARRLISSRRAYLPLAISVLAAYLSLISYYTGLSRVNYITVAIIVNTGPIWAGLIAYYVSGNRFPRLFWTASLLSFGAVSLGLFLGSGLDFDRFLLELLNGLVLLPVPILFYLGFQIRHKFLGEFGSVAPPMVSQVLSSGLFLIAILVIALPMGWRPSHIADHPSFSAMFIAGSVSMGILGSLLLQAAIRAKDGDSGYVSQFFLLIPFLAGLLGALMWLLFGFAELKPSAGALWPALIVAPTLLAFTLANRGKAAPAPSDRP